jgi:choline dehydrogenase
MENLPLSSRRQFIKQATVAASSGALALSGANLLAADSSRRHKDVPSDATAMTNTDKLETFDYVVVGGGMAGCAVATRMSEDPRVRVVLLEAGQENHYEASYYSTGILAMWKGETNWHFASTPQKELGGRTIDHPRGRVIGGSAALNVGSWSRGNAADYDAWEKAGAAGWGWPTALEAFQRIEASKRPEDETRGRKGPMVLEDTPVVSDMTGLMRDACIAAGFGVTADHNGKQLEGFDLWETIFPGGRRRNTAEAYLATARSRSNLKVITSALATRVVIEGGRAVGVEFEVGNQRRQVLAAKEVLLCAGALMSPKLLMLSGIGPADHLRANGIKVLADVPGVGANLIDHLCVYLGGVAASDGVPPAAPNPGDPAQLETWRRTGYGPLAGNPYTSVCFMSSKPGQSDEDIELVFAVNPLQGLSEDPKASGYSILVAHLQPKSRGQLHLASADPQAKPLIDFCYLSHPDDLPAVIAGVRRAMALAATPPLAP